MKKKKILQIILLLIIILQIKVIIFSAYFPPPEGAEKGDVLLLKSFPIPHTGIYYYCDNNYGNSPCSINTIQYHYVIHESRNHGGVGIAAFCDDMASNSYMQPNEISVFSGAYKYKPRIPAPAGITTQFQEITAIGRRRIIYEALNLLNVPYSSFLVAIFKNPPGSQLNDINNPYSMNYNYYYLGIPTLYLFFPLGPFPLNQLFEKAPIGWFPPLSFLSPGYGLTCSGFVEVVYERSEMDIVIPDWDVFGMQLYNGPTISIPQNLIHILGAVLGQILVNLFEYFIGLNNLFVIPLPAVDPAWSLFWPTWQVEESKRLEKERGQAPYIQLISPYDNQKFNTSDIIQITAESYDGQRGSGISKIYTYYDMDLPYTQIDDRRGGKVVFYIRDPAIPGSDIVLGVDCIGSGITDTSGRFSVKKELPLLNPGCYEVYAVSYDQAGNKIESKPVTIRVNRDDLCYIKECVPQTKQIPDEVYNIGNADACAGVDTNGFLAITKLGNINYFDVTNGFDAGVYTKVYDANVWLKDIDTYCCADGSQGRWIVGDARTILYNDGASLDFWNDYGDQILGFIRVTSPSHFPPSGLRHLIDDFNAVDMVDCDKIWIAGNNGVILRRELIPSSPLLNTPGNFWDIMNPGNLHPWGYYNGHPTHLYDIKQLANGIVIAVGQKGKELNLKGIIMVSYNDGSTWSEIETNNPLNAIYDTGFGEAWIIGNRGSLIKVKYDPTTISIPIELSEMNIGVNVNLYNISGSSPTDISLVGEKGVYGYYNGEQWTVYDTGVGFDLTSILNLMGYKIIICEKCKEIIKIECGVPPAWPIITPVITATIIPTKTPTMTLTIPQATWTPGTMTPVTGTITPYPTLTITPTVTMTITPIIWTPGTMTPVTGTRTPYSTFTNTPTITLTSQPTVTPALTIILTPIATAVFFDICCTECCHPEELKESIWAVGEKGMVIHKYAGVIERVCVPSEENRTEKNLNAIECFTNGQIWIAGDDGYLFYSLNGGETWNEVKANTTENLLGINISNDGKIAYCITDSGNLWIYDRINNMWSGPITISSGIKINEIQKTTPNEIWAVGKGNMATGEIGIYYSNDNGITWSSVSIGIPVPAGGFFSSWSQIEFMDIATVNPNELYIVGSNGVILHYKNGSFILEGVDPATNLPLTNNTLNAIQWVSPENIVVVGEKGTIIVNKKGIWQVVEIPAYGHFLGICENYVCGTKGLYALPEPIIPPSNIRFDMKCGR